MKKIILLFFLLIMAVPVLAEDIQDIDLDVIEFHRDEDATKLIPSSDIFKIRVEKSEPQPSSAVIQNIENLGLINIYDQKTYRKYDRGLGDKSFMIDDNTEVILGSHNLYSAIGPTVNFIKRESSYGDYGTTVISKNKYVNIAAAAYNSSTDTGNAVGAIVSSAPIKLPVGELIVGSAVYSTNLDVKDTNRYGIFNQYKYKKFKLNTQLSKYKPNSSLGLETSTLFLSPEIDLTDSLSISTGLQNDVTNSKNSRSDLTLNYHPKKSDRNLELEVTLTNFGKEGNPSSQQRVYFGTKFKI